MFQLTRAAYTARHYITHRHSHSCTCVEHKIVCAACAAVAVSTPRESDAGYDLLLGECMLEGAPLIQRCNTMPVQQAEAVEQLLRQVCMEYACLQERHVRHCVCHLM
jgi:hypothetical protein